MTAEERTSLRKRIALILLLIIINVGVIYLLSNILSFYSSGTKDDTVMVRDEIVPAEYFAPTIDWPKQENEDTAIFLKNWYDDLSANYTDAEMRRNKSIADKESMSLEKYFTDSVYHYLLNQIEESRKSEYSLDAMNISHRPRVHNMSVDQKQAMLTDSALVSYSSIRKGDLIMRSSLDSSIVRFFMLMEDGRWRVHKRKVLKRKSTPMSSLSSLNPPHTVTQNDLATIKGINYYPQKTPWKKFWVKYDPQTTTNDLLKIKSLGINTIRIFIPYFDVREKAYLHTVLSNSQDFLNQSHQMDFKVIVTLFDFYEGVDHHRWGNQIRYVDTVVHALDSLDALWAWDLKNEPDLDFDHSSKEEVLDWLRFFTYYLHKVDNNHPVTVGWAHAQNASLIPDFVDFISFHDYEGTHNLDEKIKKIRRVTKKAIAITEAGRSTYHGVWQPYGADEYSQAQYYARLNDFKNKTKIPYLAWTLYDFDSIPQGIVKNLNWRVKPQEKFGICHTITEDKEAATVIKQNKTLNYKKYENPLTKNASLPILAIAALLIGIFIAYKIIRR